MSLVACRSVLGASRGGVSPARAARDPFRLDQGRRPRRSHLSALATSLAYTSPLGEVLIRCSTFTLFAKTTLVDIIAQIIDARNYVSYYVGYVTLRSQIIARIIAHTIMRARTL